ncbi:hypothetical protein [Thiothrix nivea]|uniref:Uncharacterized protein n=1 Tax=Thiothrix nivea (strain ATCC 35100 / DSM 5205 / JP2) TaxID=870187 RepID=A0A656HLG5_THINJ|nr:hypothetical protein [Thiothrix nivea]EIJ36964.1 hypothetical protein Thini_4490 [Thiothrix nivea DSM 5205]
MISFDLKYRDYSNAYDLAAIGFLLYFLYMYFTGDYRVNVINYYLNQVFNIQLSFETQKTVYMTSSMILLAYLVNSRTFWVLMLAVIDLYILTRHNVDINNYFSSLSDNYIKILQSFIPLLVASPFAFIIWMFRNNDKTKELQQKEREYHAKLQELDLRKEELKNKVKSLNQDYNLKSIDQELKEREISLKERELELKNNY